MTTGTENKIRAFIAENFLFREDLQALSETQSLLDAGLIDSTGVLELVAFLETTFPITIEDADIVPENLDTVKSIVAYVERKLSENSAAA
jgi:acyl carrier protein